jgi:hypothetical protein
VIVAVRRRALAVLVPTWVAACSGGSDVAPTTSSTPTFAERFDEAAVVDGVTELALDATAHGLTPRSAELMFRGCGGNEADEQVYGAEPKYFYVASAALDEPIGEGTIAHDLDRIGNDVADAAGWSAPGTRGMRHRDGLRMRSGSFGPRLVLQVHGPCLAVDDQDAARAHALGDGRQTLALPGKVPVTDRPIPLGDGTYLPASEPDVGVPGG